MSRKSYRNRIELTGRVSKPAIERTLPSGDVVAEFRVIVERDDREGVDTLDVALWSAPLRKTGMKLVEDEWVSIKGVIRRRFWRAGSIPASRWQVEARDLVRI